MNKEGSVIISPHALIERDTRIYDIMTHEGLGEPIAKYPDHKRKSIKWLTDTGIIIVWNEQENFIITLYRASRARAESIYKWAHGKPLPRKVFNIVKNRLGQKEW